LICPYLKHSSLGISIVDIINWKALMDKVKTSRTEDKEEKDREQYRVIPYSVSIILYRPGNVLSRWFSKKKCQYTNQQRYWIYLTLQQRLSSRNMKSKVLFSGQRQKKVKRRKIYPSWFRKEKFNLKVFRVSFQRRVSIFCSQDSSETRFKISNKFPSNTIRWLKM